jgi:hypothetical protein
MVSVPPVMMGWRKYCAKNPATNTNKGMHTNHTPPIVRYNRMNDFMSPPTSLFIVLVVKALNKTPVAQGGAKVPQQQRQGAQTRTTVSKTQQQPHKNHTRTTQEPTRTNKNQQEPTRTNNEPTTTNNNQQQPTTTNIGSFFAYIKPFEPTSKFSPANVHGREIYQNHRENQCCSKRPTPCAAQTTTQTTSPPCWWAGNRATSKNISTCGFSTDTVRRTLLTWVASPTAWGRQISISMH